MLPFWLVLEGALIGGAVGMVLAMLGFNTAVTFFTQMGVSLIAVMTLAVRWDRKHPRPQRPLVTPSDFPLDADTDPLLRHVLAQTWNSGEPMVGFYDGEGNMHFREVRMPRVPVTIFDKDGNTTDAFAEAVAMLDEGVAAVGIKNLVDLDGNVVGIPPGGRIEGDIYGIPMTGDEYRD